MAARTSGAGRGMPTVMLQPRDFDASKAVIVMKMRSGRTGGMEKAFYVNYKHEGQDCAIVWKLGDCMDGPETQPTAGRAPSDEQAPGSGKWSFPVILKHKGDIEGMLRFKAWFYEQATQEPLGLRKKGKKTVGEQLKQIIIEPDPEPTFREDGSVRPNNYLMYATVNETEEGQGTQVLTYGRPKEETDAYGAPVWNLDPTTVRRGNHESIGPRQPLMLFMKLHHIDTSKGTGPIHYMDNMFVERPPADNGPTITVGGQSMDFAELAALAAANEAQDAAAKAAPPTVASTGSGAPGAPGPDAAPYSTEDELLTGGFEVPTGGTKRAREGDADAGTDEVQGVAKRPAGGFSDSTTAVVGAGGAPEVPLHDVPDEVFGGL